MTKYNILEQRKEKPATYRTQIKPEVIDGIYEQILRKMIVEKCYRDPKYTAQRLAEEIGTNPRYISAAVSLRFHTNYSMLINDYRVRYAKLLLEDRRYKNLTIGDIAKECGFANRQSFYVAFYRSEGKTPKEYQSDALLRQGRKR